jgi:hypothetical protein
MSEGEGFTRRVTLANLYSFAPLLKKRRAAGQGGVTDMGAENEQSTDSANQGLAGDPELAAAEALFAGESIKTGIRYSRLTRGHPGPAGGTGGRGLGGGHTTSSGSEEVLLMRVRPRRNGNQVQISKRVLNGSFMNGATEVVLTDGSRRQIGSNTARGGRNTERFEAPGLGAMTNPVARLRWTDAGDSRSGTGPILRFELFDAASGGEGARIFRKLEDGIAEHPMTNLNQLSRERTVLSKRDRDSAQWYRLDSI